MNDHAKIIEGGCHHFPHSDCGPKIARKYVILSVIIEIIAIAVVAYRLLGK